MFTGADCSMFPSAQVAGAATMGAGEALKAADRVGMGPGPVGCPVAGAAAVGAAVVRGWPVRRLDAAPPRCPTRTIPPWGRASITETDITPLCRGPAIPWP